MTEVHTRNMTVLQLELSWNDIWHGFLSNLFLLPSACGCCCPLLISQLSCRTRGKAMCLTLGNALMWLRRTMRYLLQANCTNVSVPLWLLHFGLLEVDCIREVWSRVADFNYCYCVKELDPQTFNLPFSNICIFCNIPYARTTLACLQYQMFWYDIEYCWLLLTYCLLPVAMMWILLNS
jgi:hypothetical protein